MRRVFVMILKWSTKVRSGSCQLPKEKEVRLERTIVFFYHNFDHFRSHQQCSATMNLKLTAREFCITSSFLRVKVSWGMFISPFWNDCRSACVRPRYKTKRRFLLHDNAPAHQSVAAQISATKTSVCTQPFPYSPDLSPCDYFLFCKLWAASQSILKTLKTYRDISSIPPYQTKTSSSPSFQWLNAKRNALHVLMQEECTLNNIHSPKFCCFSVFFFFLFLIQFYC